MQKNMQTCKTQKQRRRILRRLRENQRRNKIMEKNEGFPTGNDYYTAQWQKFRKSYDVRNKYIPVGQDHYFGNFKYEATQWNEPMLRKMHKTIRLEGRPNTKATKEQ